MQHSWGADQELLGLVLFNLSSVPSLRHKINSLAEWTLQNPHTETQGWFCFSSQRNRRAGERKEDERRTCQSPWGQEVQAWFPGLFLCSSQPIVLCHQESRKGFLVVFFFFSVKGEGGMMGLLYAVIQSFPPPPSWPVKTVETPESHFRRPFSFKDVGGTHDSETHFGLSPVNASTCRLRQAGCLVIWSVPLNSAPVDPKLL